MQGIFQTLVIEDEDTYNMQRCYDIEDEEKEDELFNHIERLGLAGQLLSTPAHIPIRIIKNN